MLSDTSMNIAVSYGAALNHKAPKARRIAVLIDERGVIAKIYDPAGTGDFPEKVIADLKRDEL